MSSLALDLLNKLEQDPQLAFKKSKGKYLSGGTCPDCGKPEVFVSKEKPWVVRCNRANNCNYSENTRDRYPELFEAITERFPVTEDDPDAPARAYLTYNRGFRATKVSGWYSKGIRTLFNAKRQRIGEVLTVRFPLWGEHYWERIIDRKDIERNGGKKAHISYGCDFKDKGWTPPEQEIEEGDWVFITEGIFQSAALTHLNPDDLAWPIKVIASISSSNLPRDFIKLHKGKNITWVLAFDNDPAGLRAMEKFQAEVEGMGEKVRCAVGEPGRDWDDEWRLGKLNQSLIDDALWQGAVAFASSVREAAFWQLAKYPHSSVHRFGYRNALYASRLDDKEKSDLPLADLGLIWAREAEQSFKELFAAVSPHLKVRRIANCLLQFLYLERDVLTDEQFYCFRVRFASGNPEQILGLEGSVLENPSALKKALLNRTAGGTFSGSATDLEHFHELWFDRKACQVTSVPFIGYDRDSETYVFPKFGYHKGRCIPVNDQGYVCTAKYKLKTQLKERKLVPGDGLLDWGEAYALAFDQAGIALLSWWLGTLFAEQIRAAQQSWPFLEFTGEQGAGKSTLLEILWRALGIINEEGFDPSKSSKAGRARKLVQLANMPVVLIEGDRDSNDRSSQFDLDELKTAYNGRIVRAMGVRSNSATTDEKPFRGAICISQNATVQGSEALLSRIVHCHFTREHHNDQSFAAANHLFQMPVQKLAAFLDKALRMEKPLLDAYFEHFLRMENVFKAQFPKMQSRLIKNHSQVAAWAHCLPMMFDNKAFSPARLNAQVDYLKGRAESREQRLSNDPPNVKLFWDIYDTYNEFSDNNFDDSVKRILFNHSKNDHLIAIQLVDFERTCNQMRLPRVDYALLEQQLPLSRRYKFIRKGNVKSQLLPDGRTRFCWIFNKDSKT